MFKWIAGLVALLMLVVFGTGCSSINAQWTVDKAHLGTQFQIGWGTVVSIGFPGYVEGSASGEGEKTPAPPEATPIGMLEAATPAAIEPPG